jgi:peptidoglycan/LPS O-acetylase OafA/YrhL
MSSAALSSPSRLPALDAVRAIGAVAVLAYHVAFNTGVSLNGTWNGLLARLDVGVAVFFVLSGFLLFRPFAYAKATAEERPGVGRYLWRRALRILPAYWVTVAACLLLLPQNADARATDWVRTVTLTQIYSPALLRHGLTQTWSLATEVAFYLVLPLAAVLALGRRWRPARTAIAITVGGLVISGGWVAAMVLGWIGTALHPMWLPSYGIWFGVGMAMATVHVALVTGGAPRGFRLLHDLAAAPLACWGLALGLLAVASTPLAGPRTLVELTPAEFGTKVAMYAVIAGLILLPVAFGPENWLKSALSGGLARWFGAISYGIFLWHPFVIDVMFLGLGWPVFTGDYVLGLFITFSGATVLAACSYYAVERPIQRLGARWPMWRRRGSATESHRAVAATSAAS